MIRRILVATAALSLFSGRASAQANDFASTLAAGVEQLGQTVGEAALGGSSLFVTAKGSVPVDAVAASVYAVTAEAQAPTARAAAELRDAKVEKLRAVARQFQVTMTLGDANYQQGVVPLTPIRPVQTPASGGPPPLPLPPTPLAARPRQMTANIAVRFSRPPDKSMPAFLDALHEAGIETLPATSTVLPSNLGSLAFLGIGAPTDSVNQAVWDKAAVVAVGAARRQAEVLAQASGRHLGEVRSLMVLNKALLNGQAVMTVAVRFAFAP